MRARVSGSRAAVDLITHLIILTVPGEPADDDTRRPQQTLPPAAASLNDAPTPKRIAVRSVPTQPGEVSGSWLIRG